MTWSATSKVKSPRVKLVVHPPDLVVLFQEQDLEAVTGQVRRGRQSPHTSADNYYVVLGVGGRAFCPPHPADEKSRVSSDTTVSEYNR